MSVIKRMINFDRQDWKHCAWLFTDMIKNFLLMNFNDSDEAWKLFKLHLTHDSCKKN